MNIFEDRRVVMTLDAGGTNFVFSAMQAGQEIVEPITLPSMAHDLSLCLANLRNGFHAVRSNLLEAPVAISFAFPGPTDYPNGVVGDLGNLPAFRGGVAVGPMLSLEFGIPVFMNNDGDLYAFGEAIAGYLPWVNDQLEKSGSPKRFKNLVGFTLGTGFGGGIVADGRLYLGDNSAASEVWLLSQRYNQCCNIEENISIRAVKRAYAELTGVAFENAPTPKDIYDIGVGMAEGDRDAAIEAFRRMGQALGDALCNVLTVVDGIAVIGGGVSGARSLFVPAMLEEMRSSYTSPGGSTYPRLAQKIFYLDDANELAVFCKGDVREVEVPHSKHRITYDPMARVGIGFSQIGTSRAISIGAYAYALSML